MNDYEKLYQKIFKDFDSVEINPKNHGGAPVIRGHRFTVALLLAELATGDITLEGLADECSFDVKEFENVLNELSSFLNEPQWRDRSKNFKRLERKK